MTVKANLNIFGDFLDAGSRTSGISHDPSTCTLREFEVEAWMATASSVFFQDFEAVRIAPPGARGEAGISR